MIYRVASAHEEGGERVYAVSTTEILGDGDGQVAALRLVEVRDRERPVRTGRRHRAGAARAAGPAGHGLPRAAAGGVRRATRVELDARGNVVRDDGAYMTSVPGVFVAGDAGRGQSLIVWAIAEGRAAAHGSTPGSWGPQPAAATDQPDRPTAHGLTRRRPAHVFGRAGVGSPRVVPHASRQDRLHPGSRHVDSRRGIRELIVARDGHRPAQPLARRALPPHTRRSTVLSARPATTGHAVGILVDLQGPKIRTGGSPTGRSSSQVGRPVHHHHRRHPR
jgi:hypothetical protein